MERGGIKRERERRRGKVAGRERATNKLYKSLHKVHLHSSNIPRLCSAGGGVGRQGKGREGRGVKGDGVR